ncbi:unnamed protein product [Prorocentrum cordatum]|uniref:Uncharacterized protein n=1 Tax=Prorocentrum cordatum TaxID=2364126 RepID=A0ABN9XN08_9DINO|nr:unnamed protein product [Polarella glacialis]
MLTRLDSRRQVQGPLGVSRSSPEGCFPPAPAPRRKTFSLLLEKQPSREVRGPARNQCEPTQFLPPRGFPPLPDARAALCGPGGRLRGSSPEAPHAARERQREKHGTTAARRPGADPLSKDMRRGCSRADR